MYTARILKTVCLLLILAVVAGCATSNEYVNKIFAPRTGALKDTTQVAVKFLELDSLDGNDGQWVKTEITKKDTTTETRMPSTEEPVVKSNNTGTQLPIVQGTRTKKTRE